MTSIKISELHPAGAKLFSDSENYLKELSELEINTININGGSQYTMNTIDTPSVVISCEVIMPTQSIVIPSAD